MSNWISTLVTAANAPLMATAVACGAVKIRHRLFTQAPELLRTTPLARRGEWERHV
ncbi:MAG: hypothetical protein HRU17_15660 [Polyangiaceae bacterium]|nr:hypothetical protein [Polyangiaceae bacterium]